MIQHVHPSRDHQDTNSPGESLGFHDSVVFTTPRQKDTIF